MIEIEGLEERVRREGERYGKWRKEMEERWGRLVKEGEEEGNDSKG